MNKKLDQSNSIDEELSEVASEILRNQTTGNLIYPKCIPEGDYKEFEKLGMVYEIAAQEDKIGLLREISLLLTIYYWLKRKGDLVRIFEEIYTYNFYENIWINKVLTNDEKLSILANRLKTELGDKFSTEQLKEKIQNEEKILVYKKPKAGSRLEFIRVTGNPKKTRSIKKLTKYDIDLNRTMNKISNGQILKQEAYQLISARLSKLYHKQHDFKTIEKRIERIRGQLKGIDKLQLDELIEHLKVISTDEIFTDS